MENLLHRIVGIKAPQNRRLTVPELKTTWIARIIISSQKNKNCKQKTVTPKQFEIE